MLEVNHEIRGNLIFLASTLQSMTGFGFAVLAVPLLVPLLPPRDAVALIMVLSTATTVLAWWRIRAETAPGWTWRLLTAGLWGVPLDLGALVSVPADWLRIGVGLGSLLVASVLLWSEATTASGGPVAGTPPHRPAAPSGGRAPGGMDGPPGPVAVRDPGGGTSRCPLAPPSRGTLQSPAWR